MRKRLVCILILCLLVGGCGKKAPEAPFGAGDKKQVNKSSVEHVKEDTSNIKYLPKDVVCTGFDDIDSNISYDNLRSIWVNGNCQGYDDFLPKDEESLYSMIVCTPLSGGSSKIGSLDINDSSVDSYTAYEEVDKNGVTECIVTYPTFTIKYEITYSDNVFVDLVVTVESRVENCSDFCIETDSDKYYLSNSIKFHDFL